MIDKPDVHEDDLEAKKFGASGGVRADLQSAAIPIEEEEEVADADATLEARASRSNPEE